MTTCGKNCEPVESTLGDRDGASARVCPSCGNITMKFGNVMIKVPFSELEAFRAALRSLRYSLEYGANETFLELRGTSVTLTFRRDDLDVLENLTLEIGTQIAGIAPPMEVGLEALEAVH